MWSKNKGGSTDLSGLVDVDHSTTPTDGQVLTYDSSINTWTYKTPQTVNQLPPATNVWAGKKFNCLGDSITQGATGTTPYPALLQNDLQLTIARNYGVGGTTIADGHSPFYSRVSGMDSDADVITVLGGTNDFGLSTPMGSLYTLNASNVKVPTTDTTTFYGAYHALAQNLIAKYPDKHIILFTPMHRAKYTGGAIIQPDEFTPNSAGYYLSDYVDAVIQIAKWYSFPVCDLYTLSGMNPNQTAQQQFFIDQQLHPNNSGYVRLSKVMEGFLNTIVP